MSVVNYIREHMRFMEYAADEQLSSGERLVWYALMHIMNQRAQGNVWPDQFVRVSNARLLTYCPMKYDTMAAAREGLRRRGLIDFICGEKNKTSPAYRVNYFFPQGVEGAAVPVTPEADEALPREEAASAPGQDPGLSPRCPEIPDNAGDIEINLTETETTHRPDVTGPEGNEEESTVTEDIARADAPTVSHDGWDECLRAWMQVNNASALFGDSMGVVMRLISSGRYPTELVAQAMALTLARNDRGPRGLVNPHAYMLALLADWDRRGLRTIEAVHADREGFGDGAPSDSGAAGRDDGAVACDGGSAGCGGSQTACDDASTVGGGVTSPRARRQTAYIDASAANDDRSISHGGKRSPTT